MAAKDGLTKAGKNYLLAAAKRFEKKCKDSADGPIPDTFFCTAAYNIAILLKVPLSKEKQQFMKETAAELGKSQQSTEEKEAPFPASYYVLKPDMMEKMGYPMPKKAEDGSQQLPEGFVSTVSRGVSGGGFY